MTPHLRGEVAGMPLTKTEHDILFGRALGGSLKDTAAAMGRNAHTLHHHMASVFAKLEVEDITAAFVAMGWLHPLAFGVSPAEARHENLLWEAPTAEVH